MTAHRLPDETDPAIRKQRYKFRAHIDPHYVFISNGKEEKPYRIDVLQRMVNSNLPKPLRDMAQDALVFMGKEDKKPEEIKSDTITTIDGVKIYTDLMTRKFMARIRGKLVKRTHLSDLEREIRRGA